MQGSRGLVLKLEKAQARAHRVHVEHGPVPGAFVGGTNCNCVWQPQVEASPLTRGRKGLCWIGAPSLSLLTSLLPSSTQSVSGAPSSCQPDLAAGQFNQAGAWRKTLTEVDLGARRCGGGKQRGCQQGFLAHGSGRDLTFRAQDCSHGLSSLVQPT